VSVDYAALVQPTRVHGSLYTDPAVFADELERIWYRGWVCVGHESEVPRADAFVRTQVGPQDLLMTRTADGAIHVLHNRCAHRGARLCEAADGTAAQFRCPYHGWTFGNDGRLRSYPYPEGYGGAGRLELDLVPAARVATHEGFVFASLAPEGPTLAEHLGAAAEAMTRLARLSPTGTLDLGRGWLRHRTRANWKFVVENETDGYHPAFVHRSIFAVAGNAIGSLYSEGSLARTRDLGGGHSENDLRPEFRRLGQPMGWFGTTPERVPAYAAALRDARGAEADASMIDGAPHVMVFPNLFIAEISVFLIQPLAADLCLQLSTAVQFGGAPDLNRRMLQQSIGSVGPAGLLLADDAAMYERNQAGVAIRDPEWLDVRRGLARERVGSDGHREGGATDETGMRGFWRHYLTLMAQGRR
jgi:fatty-acyl-CoA synthase